MRLQNKIKILIIFTLVMVAQAFTQEIIPAKVTWDANTESNLAGYKLYLGRESGNYEYITSMGVVTEKKVDFHEGEVYYLALTAFNNMGAESDFSKEVYFSAINGDVNNDGMVDGADWLTWVLAWKDGTVDKMLKADFNKDTARDGVDITCIKMKILGMIP